jgi:hypothetical protein
MSGLVLKILQDELLDDYLAEHIEGQYKDYFYIDVGNKRVEQNKNYIVLATKAYRSRYDLGDHDGDVIVYAG